MPRTHSHIYDYIQQSTQPHTQLSAMHSSVGAASHLLARPLSQSNT